MPSPGPDKPGSPRKPETTHREKVKDDGPKAQKAFKYQYNADDETWSRTECSVLIANKAFQEGGMRYCYKMYEIGIDGKYAPGVAKIFKPEVSDDDEELTKAYFDEAMTQTVADCFAKQFNHSLPQTHKNMQCRFLPVKVLHLSDQGHTLCNAEPYLQGEYMKHNDNDGHIESDLELPQAFSHFTWEASNQSLLVCDIQGVGNFYTDPQIHSHDGEGFGMGNIGQAGIDKFLQSHTCNSICKVLGLVQPSKDSQGGWCSRAKDTNTPIASRTSKAWSSIKYKGVMQKAITKLKQSIGASQDSKSQQVNDMELTLQQQKLLQEKLMKLVQQKGSLENQMLMSPHRTPVSNRGAVSPMLGAERDKSKVDRLSSSYDWDGSVEDEEAEEVMCKHCGVSGNPESVAAHGRHHSELCPRRANEDGKKTGKERPSSAGRWCSEEVQRLQMLLEAQSARIKGLDMGELRLRCYDYDRP